MRTNALDARCHYPANQRRKKHWLADTCGHPSTEKGPSSVNTAEIKIVQPRLKRAIELGMELAPVVPIDRNVPHQLHEQRTKSCARGTSGQEEQESRRAEADRQLGLQTSSTRGDRLLPLSREVPWSGSTVESGGGPLQEQSTAERPASPRPQQESDIHGSCAQQDSDERLRFALRRGEGRGGSPQQSSSSTTQTVPARSVDRTQNNPALLHEPVTAGKRGGNLLLLLSQTRSQQTCPVIQSTATFSSQRPHDTHQNPHKTRVRSCLSHERAALARSLMATAKVREKITPKCVQPV